MAVLKICVQKQRRDGYWPVYIRVTHNRKSAYMKTDKVVNDKGLTKSKDVRDPHVVTTLSKRIADYMDRLNRVDSTKWTCQDVIKFLQTGDLDVSFSDFCRKFIARMQDRGQVRNTRNYEMAMNHFEKYVLPIMQEHFGDSHLLQPSR